MVGYSVVVGFWEDDRITVREIEQIEMEDCSVISVDWFCFGGYVVG